MLINTMIIAFWLICICIVAVGWQGILGAEDLDFSVKGIVIFLILVGAPFIVIGNLISALLDTMLPPGWDGES